MNGGFLGSIFVPSGRHDPDQHVVDGSTERATVAYQLGVEVEDVGNRAGAVLEVLIAPLAEDVEKEDRALPGVEPVLLDRPEFGPGDHPIRRRCLIWLLFHGPHPADDPT